MLLPEEQNNDKVDTLMNNDKTEKSSEKNTNKKYIIIIILFILLIIIGLSIFFLLKKINVPTTGPFPIEESFYYDEKEEIKKYIINNGSNIQIGIFSDLQLATGEDEGIIKYTEFRRNAENALRQFKKNAVDVIIIAGDIVDHAYKEEYELYLQIFNKVYTKEDKIPLTLEIMGNHEFYEEDFFADYKRENMIQHINLFKKYIKKNPFYHVTINDFHFIFWSHQSFDCYENKTFYTNWIEKELKLANNTLKNPGDPIFVITHAPPKDTVYGSGENLGFKVIYDVLKRYSNIISISGHTHRSLRHERSIWQKDFTAINTQSVSFISLNYTYYKSEDIIVNSIDSDMGFIADLDKNGITFKRMFFNTSEVLSNQWAVKFPIKKEEFLYTYEKNQNKYGIPQINNHEIKIESNSTNFNLSFYPASHQLFIHSYRFEYYNKKQEKNVLHLYGSYYLSIKQDYSLPIFYSFENVEIDIYKNYSLYAIDFYFNEQKY